MKKSISGIRGIFGKDLLLNDVLEFCNNFSKLIETQKCVIGNDTRPSGDMIRETASAAIMQNGIDVLNLGMAPTPVVFREARRIGAGIVVTSSHNPIEWNGLKFIKDGRGIIEDELKTVTTHQDIKKTKIGKEEKIETDYVDDAAALIGEIKKTSKVAVDIGGGAAKNIAPVLLKKLGCTVNTINENLSTSSRGPDPTADSLDDLLNATKNSEIGFAFDLDGDRLVVVNNGKKQTPDVTLGLGVAKALELGYKKFVLSIDSSVSVEKFIKNNGGMVERSKVGEANVIELMQSSGAQAGGEGSSGGFILPEFNYCRDGILTSGFIASMLGDKSFDDILSFMESYHQIRNKVSVESNLHDSVIENLYDSMKSKYSEISTLDGIKAIIDEDTWTLIRKSNTEDIIRVSTESNDIQKGQQVQKETEQLVRQCYEKIR